MKRAAIYARVSTKDQEAETQVPLMMEWCQREGFQVDEQHIFMEWASGKDPSRPLQKQLMQAAKGRHVHAVVCWRLDRWGRSTLDALAKVEQLKELGLEFHAIKEGIHLKDWDTDGRFRLELMQALASRERNLIADRTREAFTRLERQGWPNGRPGRPRAPCHDCGGPRDEAKALKAKRSGQRVPICSSCKAKGGHQNGMAGSFLETAQNQGGFQKDRFEAPGEQKAHQVEQEKGGAASL